MKNKHLWERKWSISIPFLFTIFISNLIQMLHLFNILSGTNYKVDATVTNAITELWNP